MIVLRKSSDPTWRSDELEITVDVWSLSVDLARRVRDHILESIRAGRDPAGGSQKPLKAGTSRAKAAAAGRRSAARGTGMGRFLAAIVTMPTRRRKAKSKKVRAKAAVTVKDPGYWRPWLEDELARGVDYFPDRGDIEKIVVEMVSDALNKAVK